MRKWDSEDEEGVFERGRGRWVRVGVRSGEGVYRRGGRVREACRGRGGRDGIRRLGGDSQEEEEEKLRGMELGMPDSVPGSSSSVWIPLSWRLRRGGGRAGVRLRGLGLRRGRGVVNWGGGGDVCVALEMTVLVGEDGRRLGFKSCMRDSIASARS